MTGLLASVCSPAEARIARDADADIIDCKDPHHGALGALPAETITHIVATVRGGCLTSATTGDDEVRDPRALIDAIDITADCGVDYVKFGLFEERSATRLIDALSAISHRHALIAVCFVDRYDPTSLIGPLAGTGVRGVMLDTADKRAGSLCEICPPTRLARFVADAQASGLICGLAGRLGLRDIPALLPLRADYLGFRSALCGGNRRRGIAHAPMMQVRGAIPRVAGATGGRPVDVASH